ncbi:MAG: dihydrofolate reductase family protein [Dehalococcoidia bacterium]|nr:dihydrofolate reductase family protein [Dehalococcoidia bacterium]
MPKPDYTSLELPPPPPGRPYVILNMVMSADGKVVVEGTEQGIGSKVDQRLMRELRVNADVVLNGASTLRASGTSSRLGDEQLEALRVERGKPRFPVAAVLSRSGDLPLDRIFFTARDFPAVVYLSDLAPAARREALVATGRDIHIVPGGREVAAMLRHMREELGAAVLLCEGGPDVNAQMWAHGFVDEYFVTLGPVIVAGRDTLTAAEGPRAFARDQLPHLDLVSAIPNEETNEVYLRYRTRRT